MSWNFLKKYWPKGRTVKTRSTVYMSQGKAHKKYEYGCKASVVLTQKTGIIVGAMTFKTNVYDGHTLEKVLGQATGLTGKTPKTATVDRGYKGKQQVGHTQILLPIPPLKRDSEYQKRKKRKHHRRRAAIEPIIGHLKSDHRAARNFLKGQIGNSMNFIMAAAGFNFSKLMVKLQEIRSWLYIEIVLLIYKDIFSMQSNTQNNMKLKPFFKGRLTKILYYL